MASLCAILFAFSGVLVSHGEGSCIWIKYASAIQDVCLSKDIFIGDVARKSNTDFVTNNLVKRFSIECFFESQKSNYLSSASTKREGFSRQLRFRDIWNNQLDKTADIFRSRTSKILDTQSHVTVGSDRASRNQASLIEKEVGSLYNSHCCFGKVSTLFGSVSSGFRSGSLRFDVFQGAEAKPNAGNCYDNQRPIRNQGIHETIRQRVGFFIFGTIFLCCGCFLADKKQGRVWGAVSLLLMLLGTIALLAVWSDQQRPKNNQADVHYESQATLSDQNTGSIPNSCVS